MNDFEGDRTIFIAAFTAYVAYLNILVFIEYNKNLILEVRAEANFERKKARDRLINDLNKLEDSLDVIRMRPHAFQRLCYILRGTGRLRDNQYSCADMKINHVPINSTGAVEKRRYGSGAMESNRITGNSTELFVQIGRAHV